jgi:hypothetical protein
LLLGLVVEQCLATECGNGCAMLEDDGMTFTVAARRPQARMLGIAMAMRAPAVGHGCPVVRRSYGAASVHLIADPRQTQLCGRRDVHIPAQAASDLIDA